MLPTLRAVATAVVLSLLVPSATAQQSDTLRVELAPDQLATLEGVNATSLVRVYNTGWSPVVVSLHAENATGGLQLDFDVDEMSVLPGGSSSTGVTVRGPIAGDWSIVVRADGRHALSGGSVGDAAATMRVLINATANATGNGTANATANATSPAAPPPEPEPPHEDPAPAPGPTHPESQQVAGASPPQPHALSPPRASPSSLAIETERGREAGFRVAVHNPADVAQRFDVTLSLPLGWDGEIATRTLDVPAGGSAEARGTVVPGAKASAGEGELRIRGADGVARVRLLLQLPPPPAPPPEPARSEPASAPAPTPAPTTPPPEPLAEPTLRVMPTEVAAPPGASVVLTLYIANPGAAPLAGLARANVAPLDVTMDAPAFEAAAGGEALVTFVVTIPEGIGEGTTYEGAAATSLSEAAAPFSVRIESADVAPVEEPASGEEPTWLVLGVAGAGAGIAGAVALAWRRWPALGLLPLYARIAPKRAADHPRRASILALLRAEPGLTLADVRRRLGMSNGVARHHVQLLQAAGVVRAVADGSLKRLWPVGEIVKPVPPLRERALDALRETGGMRASELADTLGVSRQALHYHVKRLVDEGRVVARRESNEVTLALAA